MAKPRLKKEYRRKKTIALANGRGYTVDDNFFGRYSNAQELINDNKSIAHFFEDADGKPLTDAPKPVSKEKPAAEKAAAEKGSSKK